MHTIYVSNKWQSIYTQREKTFSHILAILWQKDQALCGQGLAESQRNFQPQAMLVVKAGK